MDLALLVYGISVLTALGTVLSMVAITGFTVLILSIIGYIVSVYEEEIATATRFCKYSAITLCISVPILVFIPSEKTMYTMVGAYAVQKVAEDPKVQQLSAKVLKVVEDKLDGYIDETTKKVAK